jgi:hypothetical protein
METIGKTQDILISKEIRTKTPQNTSMGRSGYSDS